MVLARLRGGDSRRRRGERERERGSRRRAEEANGWVPSLEALSRCERVTRSALSRSKRVRLLALQASLQKVHPTRALKKPSTRVPVRPHCLHVSSGLGLRLRGPNLTPGLKACRPRVGAGTLSAAVASAFSAATTRPGGKGGRRGERERERERRRRDDEAAAADGALAHAEAAVPAGHDVDTGHKDDVPIAL